MDISSFKYLPFSRGRGQQIHEAAAMDGALVLVELPAAAFVWGARTFSQTSSMPDSQRLYQLFNTVLSYAASLHLRIGLETVVSQVDWEEVHSCQLQSTLEPKAYRLWIPMGAGEHALFLSAVTAALTQLVVTDEDEAPKRAAKRPRREIKKTHLQPVEDKAKMMSLLRLYWQGRLSEEKTIDTSDGASDDAGWGGEEMDDYGDETGATAARATKSGVLTEYLAASAFFDNPQTQRRWADQNILPIQTAFSTYTDGVTFLPAPRLARSGLFRWFRVGSGYMLPEGAVSLQEYCLPHLEPSVTQIRFKFAQLAAAVGQTPGDIDRMSIDELVSFGSSVGSQATDPFLFSPVILERDDIEGGTAAQMAVSHGSSVQDRLYFVVSALREQTLHHYRIHLRRGNVDAFRETLAGIVHNLFGMLSLGASVDGIPRAYTRAFTEGQRLFQLIRSPEPAPIIKKAKRMFFAIPKTRKPHTFLAKMLCKLLFGGASSMGLMGPQRVVYLLVWLTMCRVMKNDMNEPASAFILAGPPDTGKSESLKRTAECVPRSLVRVTGGQSDLAITVSGMDDDMSLYIQDEMDTDDRKSRSTKLAQTALSDKTIEYRVKSQKPDGTWYLDKQVAILRIVYCSGTNFLADVPEAMLSRARVIELISNKSSLTNPGQDAGQDKRAQTNLGVATSTDPLARQNRDAHVMASRLLMAQTSRFWSLHAIAAIPTVSTLVFTAFCSILHTNYKAFQLSPRKIADLRTLSEAIAVFEAVSAWFTRVGKKFDYNNVIEAMFYTSRAFVTAEHCVAAWSIMEQSTTTNFQLKEVGSVLKTQIRTDKETGLPICVDTSDGTYFELIQSKREQIFATLRSVFPNFGLGLVRRLLKIIEEGSFDGAPNLRTLPVDGQEKILVSAAWANDSIGSPRTAAELSILRACRRLSRDSSLCTADFNNEATGIVFRSRVRASITNPGDTSGHGIMIPELKGLSDSAIALGVSFLTRVKLSDGQPGFEAPNTAMGIKYVDSDSRPNAEPSETVPHQSKLPVREIAPLVVNVTFMDAVCDHGASTETLSESDKLCLDALTVGDYDRYTKSGAVFSGVNQMGTAQMYSSLVLKRDHDPSIVVDNPFFTASQTYADFYPASDDSDDEGDSDLHPSDNGDSEVNTSDAGDGDVHPSDKEDCDSTIDPGIAARTKLFPGNKKKITLTKHTQLEHHLREKYLSRVPPEFREAFA